MNRLPAIFSKCFLIEHIQSEYFIAVSSNQCGVNHNLLFVFEFISDVSKRQFHVTGLNFDITWRRDRRLPKNPTSSGPLTELPDYTFMDGRPTPLGVCFSYNIEMICSSFLTTIVNKKNFIDLILFLLLFYRGE